MRGMAEKERLKMKKYSKQEVFDICYRGMESQGFEQCIDKEGVCRYELNGRHCIAGHFLARSLDADTWSRVKADNEPIEDLVSNLQLDPVVQDVLKDLQAIHDFAFETTKIMKDDLETYARDKGLTAPL